jgi:hypothetical protein
MAKGILLLYCLFILVLLPITPALGQDDCNEDVSASVHVDSGHPWRPPFGLDRVGHSFRAVVEITAKDRPRRDYSLVEYRNGKEIGRQLLHFGYKAPLFTDRVTFKSYPTDFVLLAKCTFQGEPVQLASGRVKVPTIEADAVVEPDRLINPVDLGTVLFPADWLLLEKGHRFAVKVAAVSHGRDIPGAKAAGWLESVERAKIEAGFPLKLDQRADLDLAFPPVSASARNDVLHVTITDADGKELWHKQIKTVLISDPPHWPRFGASKTKLWYDAPISVRNPATGLLSSISYSDAWRPELKDVVVSFPTGARFVFWRGSSYVPFWAGLHNTGLSYEWAETSPPREGFNDSVEPLMDKELRYGRVEILESTPARVHVRWTYQSCDFTYKVWGDSAAEDFYFYPDGFGTRVLSLKSALGSDYELSEFIILTPQAAYPLEVIPHTPVDLLFMDGTKREVSFPFHVEGLTKDLTWPDYLRDKARGMPALYRIRLNKDDRETAIYFNPRDANLPAYPFGPFYDRGEQVTPAYWGSHWPLGRGKTTGGSIDDRILVSPSHNSLMSWARARPQPNSKSWSEDLDTLGRSKSMTVETWVWLIGMSDSSDALLLERARSFMNPPSVEIEGGRLDFESYVPARRGIRLIVEAPEISIRLKPTVPCVNPVFELRGQQGGLVLVTLEGKRLGASDYAWDGRTLWLNTTISRSSQLRLGFRPASP